MHIASGRYESRIDEALATVGLPETGGSARASSRWAKQRLGIALALVGHQAADLDEPTNGLDPVGIQAACPRQLFRARTVVLSSHLRTGGTYGRSCGDHRGGPSDLELHSAKASIWTFVRTCAWEGGGMMEARTRPFFSVFRAGEGGPPRAPRRWR
ncbi:MAG: hypothetical protein ACLSVD_07110 [Eggerthellaceae bacterium]